MIRLATNRLLLRSPILDDTADYLAYRNDPVANAAQHMGPVTENQAREILNQQIDRDPVTPGWLMLAVEYKRTHHMIGEVGVFIPKDTPDHGNLGWWFNAAFHREGLATEAGLKFVEWCFNAQGFTYLDADCLADNTRSRLLMERLGLHKQAEGTREIEGVPYEEITYGVSREEWCGQRARH